MFIRFKINHFLFIVIYFIILVGCKLQEPLNNHGIIFLKNRSDKLVINKSNKNDVIKIIGTPHTISINNKNEWFYIERILTKGKIHKLGKDVLKENNVLVLVFNKYGILESKIILDKSKKKQVNFSNNNTESVLTKKSFAEKFLSSIKAKMYGNK
tara:strand:- start:89 stop:553 length:465 start_codon:yes stop_codon:yes gene_type:complete